MENNFADYFDFSQTGKLYSHTNYLKMADVKVDINLYLYEIFSIKFINFACFAFNAQNPRLIPNFLSIYISFFFVSQSKRKSSFSQKLRYKVNEKYRKEIIWKVLIGLCAQLLSDRMQNFRQSKAIERLYQIVAGNSNMQLIWHFHCTVTKLILKQPYIEEWIFVLLQAVKYCFFEDPCVWRWGQVIKSYISLYPYMCIGCRAKTFAKN